VAPGEERSEIGRRPAATTRARRQAATNVFRADAAISTGWVLCWDWPVEDAARFIGLSLEYLMYKG